MKWFCLVGTMLLLTACTHSRPLVTKAPAPTPPPAQKRGHSYDARDIAITQDIRRSILADRDMSVNAQNINIVTRDGHVTVLGAVDDQNEHAKVRRIVESIPGVAGLNDQLEVLNNSIAVQKGNETH